EKRQRDRHAARLLAGFGKPESCSFCLSQGSFAMTLAMVLLAVLALAYANGANDNFKGVATLFGSRTCNYRAALIWATATTLAGSLLALLLAHGLVEAFKGKGLVPDQVTR